MDSLHLALDTSTSQPLVALLQNDKLLFEWKGPSGHFHGETLLAGVDQGLQELGRKLNDLSLISVGVGPGAFTGLRIGIITSKFLADVSNVKIAPVSSLHALLLSGRATCSSPTTKIWAISDAKRHEVYALCQQCEDVSAQLVPSTEQERALSPEALALEIGPEDCLVGEGAEVFQEFWPHQAGPFPKLSAASTGQIGWWKHQNGLSLPAVAIEARYISTGKF